MKKEIKVGDTVICKPIIPGLDDMAGKRGVVTQIVNRGCFVQFGKKEVLVGDIELEVVKMTETEKLCKELTNIHNAGDKRYSPYGGMIMVARHVQILCLEARLDERQRCLPQMVTSDRETRVTDLIEQLTTLRGKAK